MIAHLSFSWIPRVAPLTILPLYYLYKYYNIFFIKSQSFPKRQLQCYPLVNYTIDFFIQPKTFKAEKKNGKFTLISGGFACLCAPHILIYIMLEAAGFPGTHPSRRSQISDAEARICFGKLGKRGETHFCKQKFRIWLRGTGFGADRWSTPRYYITPTAACQVKNYKKMHKKSLFFRLSLLNNVNFKGFFANLYRN